MAEPLKSEFAILERDLRNGRPIERALDDMAKRTESSNLRLYSTAVSVSQQTGGSLSEITERVGEAIRAKVKAKRSAEAKTSSARFEAKLVGFAPVVMLLLMSFSSCVPGRRSGSRYRGLLGPQANQQHQVRLGELRCSKR